MDFWIREVKNTQNVQALNVNPPELILSSESTGFGQVKHKKKKKTCDNGTVAQPQRTVPATVPYNLC